MPFPDTSLEDDTLDAIYGGNPGSVFGARAWQWINNVVLHLSRAHLLHNRKPYRCVAPTVLTACDVGDVIVHDLRATGAPAGGYTVRKATTGDDALYTSGEVLYLGVCVEAAAAGRKAVVALAGIVPFNIVGFGVSTTGTPVSADFASGKLKVAGGGDTVLALLDAKGNAHLTL